MFCDSYRSRIQDVQDVLKQIFRMLGPRLFQILKMLYVRSVEISENKIFENDPFFLELVVVIWCLPNSKELALGVMVTSARSENHDNGGFWGFPKMNP